MEVTTAKVAFLSISKLNIRYDFIICDSDSKTIIELCKCEVFGPNFTINKMESIGHAGKCLRKKLLIIHAKGVVEEKGKQFSSGNIYIDSRRKKYKTS